MLIEFPEIAQAVAATFEPEPGAPELVAYYAVKHGANAPDPAALVAHMRARLPAYMTPTYLERLPFIPTLVSNKADRKLLPAPKSARLSSRRRLVRRRPRPRSRLQGAESVARPRRRCRSRPTCSSNTARIRCSWRASARRFARSSRSLHVAMRDVYANPTIRRLARALDAAKPRRRPRTSSSSRPTVRRTSLTTPAARRRPRSMSSSARSRSPPGRQRSTGSMRRSTPGHALRARAYGGGPVVRRPQRDRRRGQMAAPRPRARGRDPDLERALFPLLGGEDAGAFRARDGFRRRAASSTSIFGFSARRSAATPRS